MTRRAWSACTLSRLRAPTYAEPVDASVAAAAKAMVDRRDARMPTATSLWANSEFSAWRRTFARSRCGIKSGTKSGSLIVELVSRVSS